MKRWTNPAMIAVGTLLGCSVHAHDYWIDPGDFRPPVGTEMTVQLCCGHSFPKASVDTHGHRVLDSRVVLPEGAAVALKTEDSSESLSAAFVFKTNGTHMVCLALARSGEKEPRYWTRALVAAGGEPRAGHELRTGEGMEIIPGTPLRELRVGDKLPLSVAYDGRTIRALVTTAREDGTVSHIRSTPRRPAMVKIAKPGKYLAVASVAGKKCSLTFVVARPGGGGAGGD